jgi:hypothetical protein
MKATWVTCPETAHLEKIEFLHSPVGRLIRACSRFPGCRMDCPRTCAARLDRRDREAPVTEDVLAIGDSTRLGIKLVG